MRTVVARDEMKYMQVDIRGGWLELLPALGTGFFHHITPELIDGFNTERNMPEHLTRKTKGLAETNFRVIVFPHLATIMEHYTGDEQVTIQCGINRTHRLSCPHHLSNVLN